jgi:predicted aconitase
MPQMPVELTSGDRAALEGAAGAAARLAMRIVVEIAEVIEASRLIDVTGAHVDGCLYHGRAGLEFAERLVAGGAHVAVPTTLNVSSLDLLHPGLVRTDPDTTGAARRLMDAYVAMGCRPTWTCAPYQSPDRPGFGEHVAWAESNAIVFANSVLGARTNRYGDFIDICAAITGRAPLAGLHTEDGRRAQAVFRIEDVPDRLLNDDVLGAVLGHVVGTRTGSLVPAIVGLPADASENLLKALGAAAASSGAVGMFHAVGRTPEAPTLEAALGGFEPQLESSVTAVDLRAARDELTNTGDGPIGALSLGTPHASLEELEQIAALVADRPPTVPIFVNAGRDVLAEADRRGILASLTSRGVVLVADTCTYLVPIIHDVSGPVMTNSAKWAWYAPGNLGVETVLGSLEECVRSAATGRVVRDADLWGDP